MNKWFADHQNMNVDGLIYTFASPALYSRKTTTFIGPSKGKVAQKYSI